MKLKTTIMKKILNTAAEKTPGLFRRIELQVLCNLAADTFGQKRTRVWTLTSKRGLQAYAAFTVRCMEETPVDRATLYRSAYRLGRKIRRVTGFRDADDIRKLIFLLYQNIGIEMDGRIPGVIRIQKCYFSRCYSPARCRMMSAVDAGIIAGICGGGKLHFTNRITEGCPQCRAFFVKEKTDA
ncbi:MAG: hypothetical protein IJU30_04005 [Lachnospiraceae bacterium]|nr:hypothetical protein [Lachnospiraceae bacterium]